MNIGILDTKVAGKFIEDVERYKERGFDIINATALDRPTKQYDIVASTWTQLSDKRLRNINCKAVVVKDNDEPFNVIKQDTIDRLSVSVQLIDNWGISTRVAWNLKQIQLYAPEADNALLVAETPSHDAIARELVKAGLHVQKCPVKFLRLTNRKRFKYDVVIVHLSKDDFTKYWFDQFLNERIASQLLISTTRGAIFSAKAMNIAVTNQTPQTAVLDWAWEREKLDSNLIASNRIILTEHTSYQSDQSRSELTDVTIAAVDILAKKLKG